MTRLGFPSRAFIAGVLVASLAGSVGCGSANVADEPSGSGGTGGSSGSGGTGATGGSSGTQGLGGTGGTGGSGGSGGSAPNPAAAGLMLTLTQPSLVEVPKLGYRTCSVPLTGTTYTIGMPAPGGTVPDGMDDVGVSCTVGLNGDGVTMNVSANVSGTDSTNLVPIALAVASPTIHSRDPATAEITFEAPENGPLAPLDSLDPKSFPPCMLGPFATLKNGAMLADFTCQLLGSPDDDTIGCRASGTLAVEYCQTLN